MRAAVVAHRDCCDMCRGCSERVERALRAMARMPANPDPDPDPAPEISDPKTSDPCSSCGKPGSACGLCLDCAKRAGRVAAGLPADDWVGLPDMRLKDSLPYVMADQLATQGELVCAVQGAAPAIQMDALTGLRVALRAYRETRQRPTPPDTKPCAPRDACEFCLGAKGGTPGNENIVDGVTTCDYCHVLLGGRGHKKDRKCPTCGTPGCYRDHHGDEGGNLA